VHFPLKFLNFLAPGSGTGFPIRIRIHKVTESGSNPDPQPWLQVLHRGFLPKLEAVKTDGGPTARLEAFLMAAIPAKTIPVPKGKLESNFL
jgi:hypothetical protein